MHTHTASLLRCTLILASACGSASDGGADSGTASHALGEAGTAWCEHEARCGEVAFSGSNDPNGPHPWTYTPTTKAACVMRLEEQLAACGSDDSAREMLALCAKTLPGSMCSPASASSGYPSRACDGADYQLRVCSASKDALDGSPGLDPGASIGDGGK